MNTALWLPSMERGEFRLGVAKHGSIRGEISVMYWVHFEVRTERVYRANSPSMCVPFRPG